MSSWRECKLGDVLGKKGYIRGPFDSSLKRDEMKEEGIPVYEQKNAIYNSREFRFFIDDKKFEELKRFQVQTNDLIISCSGTVGKISIIAEEDPKGIISQALLILRPEVDRVILKFLYYFLSSKQGYELLTQVSHGSVQVNIAARDIVQSIPINLPPLKEQKAIAEILSSLDDKIDLLHRQNQTLESLAQTLFRQWFIEEAKEEWEEVTLSDVMELKYGKDHKHLNDGKIPIYGSGGIMRYGDTAIYENESILIPRKGTLSNIFYVDEPFWTVDTIFWSKINSEKISGKLLFEFLKTLNFANMNVGSAVPSLTTKVLNEISFALPSLKEQEEFKQYTDNAWDKVKQNKKQIQILENLRDTLLPKLLSGEARVNYE